jgi:hypothetical protein
MSEYERAKGKLKKVETDNAEEYAKQILINKGNDLEQRPTWDHTYFEWLTDQYDDEYVKLNGELYTIEDFKYEFDPEPDYCNLIKLPDGTILFETVYYNGGTCWEEMVEDKIANFEK